MNIAIIGANGMLSVALTKFFYGHPETKVVVYGLDEPQGYDCDEFHETNLLKQKLDYESLKAYDVIIYASGAGVQAALNTDSGLMYALNVTVPIDITLGLKKVGFKGIYVSFGSYMEIGINDEDGKAFNEDDVVCSPLPVSNDYALSKRLYGRYMRDFNADYTCYHFILPNMFSEDDLKPGTRLVPYTLKYLQDFKDGKPVKSQKDRPVSLEITHTLGDLVTDISGVDIRENEYICMSCNLGGGEFLSIRSLIERLFAIYGVPCKNEYFGQSVRRDGDIKSLRLDGTKLKNVIHYLPSSKIEEIFSVQ